MASSSNSLELNLSLKPSYLPKTIANLLKDISHIHNASEKLTVLNDYINQIEEELNSIVAFKRQLPLCMLFLKEALATLKHEFMNIKNGMESCETTGRRRQDLVDFSAIKRKQYDKEKADISASAVEKYAYKGKSLMCSNSCPQLRNYNSCETKKQKTFMDFIQAQNHNPFSFKESAFSLSSLAEKGCNSREIKRGSYARFGSVGTNNIGQCGLNLRAENRTLNYQPRPLTQPIWKNNRRSWSPELHLRFVEALNLLGGVEVATPKQIREVMQVEDLTNDQVKSHLQKYRLHCRRQPEKHGDCLVNVQDPWRPQIYYGDPFLAPAADSDDRNNSNNPQG